MAAPWVTAPAWLSVPGPSLAAARQASARLLTRHPVGVGLGDTSVSCADDAEGNLIIREGDEFLSSRSGVAYRAIDVVGSGSFGTVVKCLVLGAMSPSPVPPCPSPTPAHAKPLPPARTSASAAARAQQPGSIVALKVVRNHPAYHSQATMEIHYLKQLNRAAAAARDACAAGIEQGEASAEGTPRVGSQNIVELLEHFQHGGHLVLVFEFLSTTLLDAVTRTEFRGMPLPMVRCIMTQLMSALHFLHTQQLCHADIKLENVMFLQDPELQAQPGSHIPPPPGECTDARAEAEDICASTRAAAGGGASSGSSARRSSGSSGVSHSHQSSASSLRGPSATAGQGSATSAAYEFPALPPAEAEGIEPPRIKLIDFGSSNYEASMSFHYVQSRFYRAPEVVLGLPYGRCVQGCASV